MWAHYIYRGYNKNRPEGHRFAFCMAPFTSLHFSYDGRVYPCHNNHTQAYGHISKQSISEIWKSSLRKEYQRLSKAYKMQKAGCFQCVKEVSEGHYTAVNTHRYDTFEYNAHVVYPAIMGFKFSDKCNLDCIMCYSNHHKSAEVHDVKALYTDAFFEELKTFIPHLQRAYLLGGEPFCEPLNLKLLNLITELNPACKVTIQTNGTLLTEDILRMLKKGTFDINVSIDSLNKTIFESIRCGASYDAVMANIHKLQEICTYKGTLFGTCVTPMRMNWQGLPDIVNYFGKELNAYVWFNKYYFPARYALWSLDTDTLQEIIRALKSAEIFSGHARAQENAQVYKGFIATLEGYYRDALIRKKPLSKPRKALRLLIEDCQHIINNEIIENTPEKESALRNLNSLHTLHAEKAYFYLKYYTAYFSGNRFYEILSSVDEGFLRDDVESVF